MARTQGAYSTVNRKGVEGRLQAWQAMRIMRRFTRADIMTTAQVAQSNLQKFIQALIRSGHVRLDRPRTLGRAGSRDSFVLVVDRGPKPPIACRSGAVFDPNDGQLYEPHFAPHTCDEERAHIRSHLRRVK